MNIRILLLAPLALAGALFNCPVQAQGSYSPPTTTTTMPSSPLSNAAGSAGHPLYSDTKGQLYIDTYTALPVSQFGSPWSMLLSGSLPAGTNAIGSVSVSNFPTSQAVTFTGNPGVTIENSSIPVTGSFYQSTQPVSLAAVPTHAVTQSGTWTDTVTQSSGSNLHVDVDSSPTTAVTGTVGITGTVPVTGTFYQTTQPMSAASLPLPVGAATSANQTNGTQESQLTDGTNIANVAPSGGNPAGGNAVQTSPATYTQTFSIAGAGTSTVVNCSAYRSAVVVMETNAGTVTAQVSCDGGTTWTGVDVVASLESQTISGTMSSTGQYGVPLIPSGQFRLSSTASCTGYVVFSTNTTQLPIQFVSLYGGTTVYLATTTSGGSTISKVLTTASTNLTALKVSAGTVFGWTLGNTTGSARYIHFYNSSGTVTVGTTVPYFTILIPAGQTITYSSDVGKLFTAGEEYAITTGYADTDSAATAAGDVVGEVDYR